MTDDGKAAAEVRARIEEWATALRAKDIEGILASHSADVVTFDCHSQLQFRGADALSPASRSMHALHAGADGFRAP
jgi:ketosteroid isomerase-like protein